MDWGFGVEVGDNRRGRYLCAGDTVAMANAPIMELGGSLTLGRYTIERPGIHPMVGTAGRSPAIQA